MWLEGKNLTASVHLLIEHLLMFIGHLPFFLCELLIPTFAIFSRKKKKNSEIKRYAYEEQS